MRSLPRTAIRTFFLLTVTTLLPLCFGQASSSGGQGRNRFPAVAAMEERRNQRQ